MLNRTDHVSKPKFNRVHHEKDLINELRSLLSRDKPQRSKLSKENVLFEVVRTFTGQNLAEIFNFHTVRKSAPLSMSYKERSVIFKERRQVVVLKQQVAFDHLKMFIEKQNPGKSFESCPLTRANIMRTMIKYLKKEIVVNGIPATAPSLTSRGPMEAVSYEASPTPQVQLGPPFLPFGSISQCSPANPAPVLPISLPPTFPEINNLSLLYPMIQNQLLSLQSIYNGSMNALIPSQQLHPISALSDNSVVNSLLQGLYENNNQQSSVMENGSKFSV
ncbi:unnamed protein product [Caenorhabditis brenneri]